MYPGAQDGNFLPFDCPMDHVLSPTAWKGKAYRDAAFVDALSVVVQLAVEVPAPSLLHLPLRLGGRERARVESNSKRGAARVVEVRAVHPAAAPAPPAVEQGLVIFHRTHVRVHAVRL